MYDYDDATPADDARLAKRADVLARIADNCARNVGWATLSEEYGERDTWLDRLDRASSLASYANEARRNAHAAQAAQVEE